MKTSLYRRRKLALAVVNSVVAALEPGDQIDPNLTWKGGSVLLSYPKDQPLSRFLYQVKSSTDIYTRIALKTWMDSLDIKYALKLFTEEVGVFCR